MPSPSLLFRLQLPIIAYVHSFIARPSSGGRNCLDQRLEDVPWRKYVLPRIPIRNSDVDVMQDFHSSNRIYILVLGVSSLTTDRYPCTCARVSQQ